MQLDDLDFSDGVVLLHHAKQQIRLNIATVALAFAASGLNIHKENCKILKYNTKSTNLIMLVGEALDEVETSKYLDSIIDKRGYDACIINLD
ncbi:unnamed protein product [Schistosoma margrebowiei]|uniref:Uncharacterized protein n=1 Tax=Schistosoma margrebowiei TaxID=48269 RepID=A0A183M2J9_9TREM|nr:unnamed protein product [Schistosoma margrebowiei]